MWEGEGHEGTSEREAQSLRMNAERLIPSAQVQSLIDDFYALTQLGIGIIDLTGKVLVAAGWQDICMHYFRANPATCRNCQESDLYLTKGVQPGEIREYKCKNGLWDIVTPIHVLGTHVANIFLGQFFYDDEKPNYAFFDAQCRVHGFDPLSFRAALDRIPRWSRQRVRTAMSFYTKLASMVAQSTLADLKNEEALEKIASKHTMLRKILDAIPEQVFWQRRDETYMGCNMAFAEFVGLESPESIANKSDRDLPWPRSKDFLVSDEAVMSSGQARRHEVIEVQRKDGSTLWMDSTRIPLLDAAGNVHGLLGLAQDISLRRRNEALLLESEEKLRLLLDSTGEAIYGIDLNGRCTFCNQTCLKMLGYHSIEDLIGKDMHLQIHHSRRDGSKLSHEECSIRKGFQRGQGTHVEDEVLWRADGTAFDAEYWSHPQIKNGEIIGAVVTFIDITERKHMEELLLQSQKIESVGKLAGGVAHDFNNMLGVILGHTEIVLDQLGSQHPQRENLEEILRAAQRSADITKQLLAFARKQTIVPKVLNLNDTLATMLKMIQRLIGEDIDIVWKPQKGLWNVKVDPAQVSQLLANLATNARDAIAGVGHLTIETNNATIDEHYASQHPGLVAGEYTVLSVSDDGCGIERDKIANVFDPFFTTKAHGKGTGLGLATVYGIVRQNGGFINVYSEPGHGATFRIYLPRAQGIACTEETKTTHVEGGTETILVVEDELASLQLIKRYLTSLGYRVLTVGDPSYALGMIQEKIDLLITDVVMPKMNGRQLAEQLQAHIPGLRCLFMSGYTANVIAHRGVLDHGVNFIQKPYSLNEFAIKIRTILDTD